MKHTATFLLLGFGLLSACNDSSTDNDDATSLAGTESGDTIGDGDGDPTTGDGDPTTGDGDPTTGDGDPTTGDGDGDPTTGDGDGDGDVPEQLFFADLELSNSFALGPDHVYAGIVIDSFDQDLVRVAKANKTVQVVASGPRYSDFEASATHLYASRGLQIVRMSFAQPGGWATVGMAGAGIGAVDPVALGDNYLFAIVTGQTQSVDRFGIAGGGKLQLSVDSTQIRASGSRLFGIVAGDLVEIDPDTGALTQLGTPASQFEVDSEQLFVEVGGDVWRMPIDGGALVELALAADTGGNPYSYASDDQYLYWVAKGGPGTVRRVPKSGGATETLWTHDEFSRTPIQVRVDDSHVYWLVTAGFNEPNEIWRVSK